VGGCRLLPKQTKRHSSPMRTVTQGAESVEASAADEREDMSGVAGIGANLLSSVMVLARLEKSFVLLSEAYEWPLSCT